jgi:hypothetical protein
MDWDENSLMEAALAASASLTQSGASGTSSSNVLPTRGRPTQAKWVLILTIITVLYVAGFTGVGLIIAHPLNGALTAITLAPTVILGYFYLAVKTEEKKKKKIIIIIFYCHFY